MIRTIDDYRAALDRIAGLTQREHFLRLANLLPDKLSISELGNLKEDVRLFLGKERSK